MSRSVAITLPEILGEDVRSYVKPILEDSFNKANNKNAVLTDTALNDAVETALSQAQKSVKERYNLKWEPQNQRVLLLNKEYVEDVTEEEAEETVEQVEYILTDSAKISGKSLVPVLANLAYFAQK